MPWIYLVGSDRCQSGSKTIVEPLLTVKVTHTLNQSFWTECATVPLIKGLYAPVSKTFMETNCRQLISLQAVSHVQIFPARALAQVWEESKVVYFSKLSASQENSDQLSFLLKTVQIYEPADSIESLKSLPSSGMTVAGRLYRPKSLEPHIFAKDGSSWPTPVASRVGYNMGGSKGRHGKKRDGLPNLWKKGELNLNAIPTPTSRDWKDRGLKSEMNRKSPSLPTLWKATTGTNMPASFVEWIQGLPIGHTVLSAWGIQIHREFTKKRSKNVSRLNNFNNEGEVK